MNMLLTCLATCLLAATLISAPVLAQVSDEETIRVQAKLYCGGKPGTNLYRPIKGQFVLVQPESNVYRANFRLTDEEGYFTMKAEKARISAFYMTIPRNVDSRILPSKIVNAGCHSGIVRPAEGSAQVVFTNSDCVFKSCSSEAEDYVSYGQ